MMIVLPRAPTPILLFFIFFRWRATVCAIFPKNEKTKKKTNQQQNKSNNNNNTHTHFYQSVDWISFVPHRIFESVSSIYTSFGRLYDSICVFTTHSIYSIRTNAKVSLYTLSRKCRLNTKKKTKICLFFLLHGKWVKY